MVKVLSEGAGRAISIVVVSVGLGECLETELEVLDCVPEGPGTGLDLSQIREVIQENAYMPLWHPPWRRSEPPNPVEMRRDSYASADIRPEPNGYAAGSYQSTIPAGAASARPFLIVWIPSNTPYVVLSVHRETSLGYIGPHEDNSTGVSYKSQDRSILNLDVVRHKLAAR